MPRVDPNQVKPQDLYGVEEVDNNLSMGERIRKRFRPHDTVQVMNIDDEPIEWQWLAEDDESYIIDDTHVKIVTRELPGLWRIEGGAKDILEGACAYLMIEALYKKLAVKQTGTIEHPLDERDIRNFGFDDPQKQERIIDRVFLGKVSPHAMQQAATKHLEEANAPKPKPKTSSV